jgi:hypothetical protein
MQQLSSTLQSMSLQEIVLGVLLQKKGTAYFKKEALARAFKHVSTQHRPLQGLFTSQVDPVSKKPVIALWRILTFMDRCNVVKDTGDSVHMFLTKAGKQYAEHELVENHGPEVLQNIQPLSDAVWTYADQYTRMMD